MSMISGATVLLALFSYVYSYNERRLTPVRCTDHITHIGFSAILRRRHDLLLDVLDRFGIERDSKIG